MPTLVITNNTGRAGIAEPGDTFAAVFIEALAPLSLPLTTTLTIADPPGAATLDTINMPGVASAALSMGSSGYITNDGQQAAFAASTVWLFSPTVLVVTAGPLCVGTACANLRNSSGTFLYTPAATLTDAAGNAATGSLSTAALRLF